jgi:SPFH domain / Band 7 family
VSVVVRAVITVVAVVVWGYLNFLMRVAAPLVTGPMATKQFENSNSAYVQSQYGMNLFSWLGGMSTLILLSVLVLLWWVPVRKRSRDVRIQNPARNLLPLLALIVVLAAAPAHAYYDKNNYTEVYFILPNESAFFIPDVGANKDSQATFGSEQYLRENKIAAKRFEVPHQKLSGTGFFSDYYVPTGRLIIIDRTPYSREWVDAPERGTSARKQGFPCQSKEGINITVGMSIGASVFEENSPRFLYRFGVKPPQGDRSKPELIFTSVYYGASLQEVMDGVVRNKVQTLACDEFTARTLDQANAEALTIRQKAEENIRKYLDSVGITLDFIGWADTFTFDPEVQKAINDRYAAEKIAPVLSTLQAAADIKIKEGLGKGLEAHGLPSNLVAIPTNLLDLTGMLGVAPAAGTTAASAARR